MSSNISINRICLNCGEVFIAKTTVTKYCSHKCNSRHYKMKIRELKESVSKSETKSKIPQHIKNPELNSMLLLSIKDTCKFIGISKPTIYRLFDDKVLTKIRVRGRVFISRKEINEALKI